MQRALHWLVAAGVLAAFALGWSSNYLGFQHPLLRLALYQLHETIGLIVLACVVARVVLLSRYGRPALPDSFRTMDKCMAHIGHGILYALLIFVPVVGYFANSASAGNPAVMFMMVIRLPNLATPSGSQHLLAKIHHLSAFALLFLAIIHTVSAIGHHFRGSALLRRMWSG